MKRAFLLSFAVGATLAFAGRWDGAYIKKGAIVLTAGTSGNLQVPKGAYVKVNCPTDAYVGQSEFADAGCIVPDGGAGGGNCDLIRYSMGEKFYTQLQAQQLYVAVYSATAQACIVYYNMQ